jgi:hypothetical protein
VSASVMPGVSAWPDRGRPASGARHAHVTLLGRRATILRRYGREAYEVGDRNVAEVKFPNLGPLPCCHSPHHGSRRRALRDPAAVPTFARHLNVAIISR